MKRSTIPGATIVGKFQQYQILQKIHLSFKYNLGE